MDLHDIGSDLRDKEMRLVALTEKAEPVRERMYKVVTSNTTEWLVRDVEYYLVRNWNLQGGVSYSPTIGYLQAMWTEIEYKTES